MVIIQSLTPAQTIDELRSKQASHSQGKNLQARVDDFIGGYVKNIAIIGVTNIVQYTVK
jgi:hypothetical protein